MEKTKRKFPVLAVIAVILAVLAAGMLFLLLAPGPRLHWALTMGEKYLTQGNYEQAVTMFTRAIQVDDRAEAAYLGRAEAYTQLGENEAAEADLTFVIDELGTDDAEVYLTRAAVYDALQQPEKAQADRDAAQKLGRDAPAANTDAAVVEVTPTPEPTATPVPTKTLSFPYEYNSYFNGAVSFTTAYTFNENFVLIKTVDSNGTYTYDDHGNNLQNAFSDGRLTTFDNVYDAYGNLTQVTLQTLDGQKTVTDYTYDEHGNETSMRTSDGTYLNTTNRYDEQGRLVDAYGEGSMMSLECVRETSYEYRNNGYTEKIYDSGYETYYYVTEYTLDGVPVKKTMYYGGLDSNPRYITTYNEKGCPVTVTEYQYDNPSIVIGTDGYTYNADGRLMSYSHSGSGDSSNYFIAYNYTFDGNGNVASRQAVQDGAVVNTLTYKLVSVPADFRISSIDISRASHINPEDFFLNP